MFRYGGPIKEGVMNGIREPKRNGGSMTQRVQPSNDGSRPGYAGPALLALPYIGAGLRLAARPFGKFISKQIAKKGVTGGGGIIRSGLGRSRVMKPNESLTTTTEVFNPNKFGLAFKNDPLAKTVMGGTSLFGKGIRKVGGAAKYATTTPSGLLFLGLPVTYQAGKYFLSDGTEIKGKDLNKITKGKRGTSGAPGGGDPDMYYKAPEKELTEAEKAKIESDNRIKQMDKYREIMDIKGMSKDAAYKSLIDAGKIIQEGGNLKEQLKSGKLIQNLTQAASKRFDKVGDTEAALRSLIVKGEIDKEMNKEDKALKREALKGQIAINKKSLAGLTTGEMIQKILGRAQGEYPVGDALRQIISINNPQLDAKVIPSGDIPTGTDALDYITTQITTVNNDETTPDYPEGVYVIKDRVIQVIDGQVIPIPISKL